MLKKWLFAGIISLLLIGVLVWGGQRYWQMTEREVPRLHTDDPQAVRTVAEQIKNDKGFTVVFIGDSAVYSSVAREDKNTLASHFATSMSRRYPWKDVKVYDLSLPGCSFPATYELTRYLLKHAPPDLIIADINPGWLGSSKMEHLVWQDLNTNRATPPQEIIPVPKFPDELYRPWREKNFDHLKGQPLLGSFHAVDSNPQWVAFQQQAALFAAADSSKALFFLPPRNRELYEQYSLIDDELYAEKVDLIKEQLPAEVVFADYSWAVESSLFSDLTHMFPDGNKKLAKLLAREVGHNKLIN